MPVPAARRPASAELGRSFFRGEAATVGQPVPFPRGLLGCAEQPPGRHLPEVEVMSPPFNGQCN